MKLNFSWLAPLLLSAASAVAAEQVPYFTELGAGSGWTAYDLNNDGKTWTPNTDGNSTTGTKNSVKYSYNSKEAADDWYIGPAVTLEAGKEYKTKVWYKTSGNYAESFKLMYATSGETPADLAAGTVVYDMPEFKQGTYAKKVDVFTVPENGDYYFGFYCYSAKDRLSLTLTGFEINENVFSPGPVTELTATIGADRALTCDLAWTLPTVDNDGAPLPDNAVFDAVTVYRDDREVAVLDGDATSFADNTDKGLTPGYHTYSVMVTVNGANSGKATVNTKYVGPVEAFQLPYTLDFPTMNQEQFDLFWTTVKGRNSNTTANWGFKASSYYGNRFEFYPGTGKIEDDWLISPQFKFEETGTYKLTLKLEYNNSASTNVDILFGSGTTIGGYETVIGNIKKIPGTATEFAFYVEVEQPGEYGFAVHNDNESKSYSTYYLSAFSVESSFVLPAHVTDLTATVNTDDTVTLNWTNPSKTNAGSDLTSLDKVELYCNDELIDTLTDAEPGAACQYIHTPEASGVLTYHVLAYTDQGTAEGNPVKVKTTWVGDETQTLPYSTQFGTADATTAIWKGFDANGDGYTWVITSTARLGKNTFEQYYYDNDYLLAPYTDLTPGYYTVAFKMKGGAVNKKVQLGLVSDKNNVAATFSQCAEIKQASIYLKDYSFAVKVETEGKYAVALWAKDIVDSANDEALELTQFSISRLPVVPGLATDLTVAPAEDLSLKAEISWTNPTTTNIEGVSPEIHKAIVKRNGEQVGEITEGLEAGETSSFTDEEIPQAGKYVYSVVIYGLEGCSAEKAPEVTSPWIGGGLDLPYICDNEFTASEWTIHNVNGDYRTGVDNSPITWEVNNSYMNVTSTSKLANDWAVSPRLNFEEGKTYRIEISSYNGYGNEPCSWEVHFGTGVDYTEMTHKLATVNTAAELKKDAQIDIMNLTAGSPESKPGMYREGDENVISVPAGVGTIGFYANRQGSVSVNKFSVVPQGSTGVDLLENAAKARIAGTEVRFGEVASVVSVCDLTGRVMMTHSNTDFIDLAGLGHGSFIVSAILNGQKAVVKVVI